MRCGSDAWTMVISTRCWVLSWFSGGGTEEVTFFECFFLYVFRVNQWKWHARKDYTGYYCVGCEAYLDDDEMDEGHVCKIHQKECVLRSEENYFFRLSKYWGAVRQHIEENTDFILPTSRRSQVLVWLEEDNKRDFSISRASTSWGIPVPGDDSQACIVGVL